MSTILSNEITPTLSPAAARRAANRCEPNVNFSVQPRVRVNKVGHVWTSRRLLRVLVVDDEPDRSEQLVELVRHWGHAVRVAGDGFTALRVAAMQHPDVVLLHLELPFMDGCQVARHLRLDFPKKDCLIIAVAARAEEFRRDQCLEAGIDLLLLKPVEPSNLETLLMLECVRVNRARMGDSTKLATEESREFAPWNRTPREEDGNASSATSHRTAVRK